MAVETFADRGHATVYRPLTAAQYASHYSGSSVPIVVDFGTYECRAGWANCASPQLRCRPLVGKTKHKRDAEHVRVGHQLRERDVGRLKARSPFDGQLIGFYETLEQVTDYAFSCLGLEGQSAVPHPVLWTEPLCQPNYCRARVSELLFEAYGVPAVSYCIDSLLALRHWAHGRQQQAAEALVVSHGYESTTLVPVVGHLPVLTAATRLSVGCHAQQQLIAAELALDFPQHRAQVTESRAQELAERFCCTATRGYDQELQRILLYDAHRAGQQGQLQQQQPPVLAPVSIQLPFVPPSATADSAAALQEKERRRQENVERLRAIAARRREESLTRLQADIAEYETLKERREAGALSASEFSLTLRRGGFEDELDFEATLLSFRKKLQRLLTGQEEEAQPRSEAEQFPLLSVPDAELSADELKEKRKQRLFKANADARQRKREAKESRDREERARAEEEEQERRRDPAAFVARLHERKAAIERRREERQRSSESGGGRRGATSRKRMALLAQQMGRRERGEAGTGGGDGDGGEAEDDFGLDDQDWDVYVEAALPSRLQQADAEDESEEERELLSRLEEKLALHDADYTRRQLQQQQAQQRPVEQDYQLHLHVLRIRAAETVWQPQLLGLDEAGLTESIRRCLARQQPHTARALCRLVFLTGGGSGYCGYAERLEAELRSIREEGAELRVVRGEGMLDAWKGGRQLACELWRQCAGDVAEMSRRGGGWGGVELLSRADWAEMGADYLKEHRCSNRWHPTPQADAPHGLPATAGGKQKRKR